MNLPPSAAALEIKRVRLPKIKSALNLKTWRSSMNKMKTRSLTRWSTFKIK